VLVYSARGVGYPRAAAEVVVVVEVLIFFNLVLVEAFFQKLKLGVQAQKAATYAHALAGTVEEVVEVLGANHQHCLNTNIIVLPNV